MAKRGRPKKEIDYGLVEKLATIQCTQQEIANVLEVSTKTLQRDKEFCRIYKKGLEKGKMSLRRLQFKAAENGNATMLVWLGKQYLGQTDKQDISMNADVKTRYVAEFEGLEDDTGRKKD